MGAIISGKGGHSILSQHIVQPSFPWGLIVQGPSLHVFVVMAATCKCQQSMSRTSRVEGLMLLSLA